ncbi:AAA family ATPase [Stenotrophomonas terrae]|uniref:AAA family ATPase n=1 Tax=Stenotrophomonas terrae TaxID=405446 RepID=UPI003CCD4B67
MRYQHSDVDRKNIERFSNDVSRCSLKSITLRKGAIRALSKFNIQFKYPLSAISGRNGSGKSTVLALAACAFHGKPTGWRLPGRTLPYYRFSDFFVQAHGEVPVDGIELRYGIHYDQWKATENMPDGKGMGYQVRKKIRAESGTTTMLG